MNQQLIEWLRTSQLPLTADVLRESARALRRQAGILEACAQELENAVHAPAAR